MSSTWVYQQNRAQGFCLLFIFLQAYLLLLCWMMRPRSWLFMVLALWRLTVAIFLGFFFFFFFCFPVCLISASIHVSYKKRLVFFFFFESGVSLFGEQWDLVELTLYFHRYPQRSQICSIGAGFSSCWKQGRPGLCLSMEVMEQECWSAVKGSPREGTLPQFYLILLSVLHLTFQDCRRQGLLTEDSKITLFFFLFKILAEI